MTPNMIFRPKIRYILWNRGLRVFFYLSTIWICAYIVFELAVSFALSSEIGRIRSIRSLLLLPGDVWSFFTLYHFTIAFVTLLCVSSIFKIIDYRFASIEVKRNKIEAVRGIFKKKSTAIPFSAIRTMKRYQSLSDRIVGSGRLFIASSGMNYYEINIGFLSIKDINAIYDHLEKNAYC